MLRVSVTFGGLLGGMRGLVSVVSAGAVNNLYYPGLTAHSSFDPLTSAQVIDRHSTSPGVDVEGQEQDPLLTSWRHTALVPRSARAHKVYDRAGHHSDCRGPSPIEDMNAPKEPESSILRYLVKLVRAILPRGVNIRRVREGLGSHLDFWMIWGDAVPHEPVRCPRAVVQVHFQIDRGPQEARSNVKGRGARTDNGQLDGWRHGGGQRVVSMYDKNCTATGFQD
jgi:hypothetical protein